MVSIDQKVRWSRAGAVALGLMVLGSAAYFLAKLGPHQSWLPGCLFHRLTGWHCPGCGMTRAAHAALHGEFAKAFYFNPVGMILLPLALVGIGIEITGWVRGQSLPFRLSVGVRGGWVIVALLVLFWILRNLPWWPFSLLTPS